MDYKLKYQKYKNKYLKLKNKIIGGKPESRFVVGINFEGGKIIKHILKFANCVGYVNCQIAMDAPFHSPPRVADESIRTKGRSESQFKGYDEPKLMLKLEEIFIRILSMYGNLKIIIQIARGRASEPTFNEVIKPVLDKIGLTNFETKYGYRTKDYYIPSDDKPFVFFNYGMFAELSDHIPIEVGEICNPLLTYDIIDYNNEHGFKFENKTIFETDSKNILNTFDSIKKLALFGIADDMPFITPDIYKKDHILSMIEKAE